MKNEKKIKTVQLSCVLYSDLVETVIDLEINEKTNEVVIPSSVEGKNIVSLYNITSDYPQFVSSVVIPSTVEKTSGSVFCNLSNLNNIIVDKKNPLYSSSHGVLYSKDFSELVCCPQARKTFKVPDSVKKINLGAFQSCHVLEKIVLHDNIEKIEISAFKNCTKLKSIKLPKSLDVIEWSLFKGCSSLTNVVIPAKVETIIVTAFEDCEKLKSIEVDKDNAEFASVDGVLYNKNMKKIIRCPQATKACVLPNRLKEIGEFAFFQCRNLKQIELPKSVTIVEMFAFADCSQLENVFIPAKCDMVDGCWFVGCSKLKCIDVDKKNPYFASVDGVLYSKDLSEIFCCPATKEECSSLD